MSEFAIGVEEAMSRLAIEDQDYGDGPEPCVHTFVQPAASICVGADWALADVRAEFERHGVEEAGPTAQAMNHGLVVHGARTVFFATRGNTPEAKDGER